MPAPTPQLFEAFSVEPQGSAGFFFRFKYSIQPASSPYGFPPLSFVVSGVFCHLRWAMAQPLPGRRHHLPVLHLPDQLADDVEAALWPLLLGGPDLAQRHPLHMNAHEMRPLWYLDLVLFLFLAHYGDRFAFSQRGSLQPPNWAVVMPTSELLTASYKKYPYYENAALPPCRPAAIHHADRIRTCPSLATMP